MILSFNKGYLFIANQKVASESLHLLGSDDADLCLVQINGNKHIKFNGLVDMLTEANLDLDLSEIFAFSIIRDPAEWYVSWYNSRARAPLANPSHKRHKVYTGATDFDEFLDLAKADDAHPMTRATAQSPFFKRKGKGRVRMIPFASINEVFPSIFPADSSLGTFRMGNTAHHKNKSTIRRMSSSDLTKKQRNIIYKDLYPEDYENYQKALKQAGKLKPITPLEEQSKNLSDQLRQREDLAKLAYETAIGQAQARLYRDEEEASVRKLVDEYVHLDSDSVMDLAMSRVKRFKREKDLS